MHRLSRIDRILLATLLPVWLVVFGLHCWSVFAGDLAGVPIYAKPPSGDDPYPTLGGFYPENHEVVQGLTGGERLLRVGDRDLAGVGYAGFEGIVLERATPERSVPVEFERDGERGTAQVRAVPYPIPWYRIPTILSLSAVGLIVMFRGSDRRQARLIFAGFLFAIVMAPFRGGPAWLTATGLYVLFLGMPIAGSLFLAGVMTVPDARGQPSKPGIALCLALGALSLLGRSSYYIEFPLPSELAPRGALASDAIYVVAMLSCLAWGVHRSAPERRKITNAMVVGISLASLPMLLGVTIPIIWPESPLATPLHTLSAFTLAFVPVSLMTAIVRQRLFAVDRILSAAATYSLLLVVAFGALLGLIPTLARGLSASTGLSHGIAEGLTSAGLALALVSIGRRVRPRIETLFFPERRAFADGIEALRTRLESCNSAAEVLAQLGAELDRLLRTSVSMAYLRSGQTFYACFSGGDAPPGRSAPVAIDAAIPTRALRGISSAVVLDAREGKAGSSLEPAYRDELLALGFRVLIPIEQNGRLEGFLCLGEKHSGEPYSEVEISLLAATADRASARLGHFVAEQMADEAEAADQENLARSRFLATASHDLRQPLQALSLFAGALSSGNGDADVADLAGKISRSTQALREMFDGLLDLSRIEVGGVKAEASDVALTPIFDRLAAELTPLAAERGLRLRIVETSLAVRSDAVLLGRILQNLVLNAVRYTESGSVLLGARRRGDSVHIEVRDTGPGISEEHQQAIFHEFQRIDDERRSAHEGLGLGLAIVERFAEILGHRVEVTSEPGQGSRFTLIAERVELEPLRMPTEHVALAVAGLCGRSVLVIDDDEAIRAASQLLLEQWGCEVAVVASIAEISDGVERLGGRVDAAIADFQLAGVETGTEAVRVLRATVGRDVPAVLITGSAIGSDSPEAEGLPVLAKPLAPARLRSLLVHLLRS